MKKYNDELYINQNTITLYANTNEDFIKKPITAIVVEFPGLGGGSCLGGNLERESYSTEYAIRFAEMGVILAYLFPGPWSWGNKGACRMADGVINALKTKYGLENVPIIACGGSMGGLGALSFSAQTTHKLSGVAVACPCIDVHACFDCSQNISRTFVSAVACYDMPLEQALKEISPMEQIDKLQAVPYFICNDGADQIFPEKLCDEYVERLRQRNLKVIYRPQPNLLHGEFLPEVREELHQFISNVALNKPIENK